MNFKKIFIIYNLRNKTNFHKWLILIEAQKLNIFKKIIEIKKSLLNKKKMKKNVKLFKYNEICFQKKF